jgi:hypothetical protein
MQRRLAELQREFDAGQLELQNLERRQTYLRETLLRISGAMQVLEEILSKEQPAGPNEAAPAQTQLVLAAADGSKIRQIESS